MTRHAWRMAVLVAILTARPATAGEPAGPRSASRA